MAAVLSLKWSSTTVSLLAAKDAGWREVRWRPKSGDYGSEAPVTEVLTLQADRSSDDNLATTLQSLDEMRMWADRYMRDPTSQSPVWLHAKMDGETGERRALVRKINIEWTTDPVHATGHAAADIGVGRVKIEREPWWERTAARSMPAGAEQAGASIAYDFTGGGSPHDIVGDAPARIDVLDLYSDASGANVGRFWLGLRSANKHGTLANFIKIWECEDGTNNPGESGLSDEAADDVNGASPGSGSGVFVELTPTDLDWDTIANGGSADAFLEVCQLTLSQISANETDNFGDYLWLLRYELASNATTWEVQLRWGYSAMADAAFVRGPTKEVSSTSWDYEEMGRKPIPLRPPQIFGSGFSENKEATYAVQIWARRTSGAADLHLDCLCPIPIDEGWFKAWDFDLATDVAEYLIWGEGPLEGLSWGASYNTNGLTHIAAIATNEFRLPVGDGLMICVYAGPIISDITTGVFVGGGGNGRYYERWGNLRGGE